MAKACCVCGDAADKKDNLLFTCKGHGCDVVVHQGTLSGEGRRHARPPWVNSALLNIGKRGVSFYTRLKAF